MWDILLGKKRALYAGKSQRTICFSSFKNSKQKDGRPSAALTACICASLEIPKHGLCVLSPEPERIVKAKPSFAAAIWD
jgi:hypothetical protein